MSYEVTIDTAAAENLLGRIQKHSANMRDIFSAIGVDWEDRLKLTFIEQRDPWGNDWLPLADSTLKLRKKRGSSGIAILDDSGAMKQSLNSVSNANELLLTMNSPAAVHQLGNPDNRFYGGPLAPIPARPVFPIRTGGAVDLPAAWEQSALAIVERLLEPQNGSAA